MGHFSFGKVIFVVSVISVTLFCIQRGFAKDVVTDARETEFLLTAESTFEYYCSPCHGINGDGKGTYYTIDLEPKPRNFQDADYMNKRKDAELAQVVTGGTISVGKSNRCPPWGNVFTEKKINELVEYIRGFSHEDGVKVAAKEKGAVVKEEKSELVRTTIRWLFLGVITVALAGGAINEWRKLKGESS